MSGVVKVEQIDRDAGMALLGESWITQPVDDVFAQAFARHRIAAAPIWQPIETARKDRSVIWATFHPRIYPYLEPQRPDLETWNGVQIALRHPGIVQYDDGPFDQGWGVAAPVGMGGFPDRWIVGWLPLPSAPELKP